MKVLLFLLVAVLCWPVALLYAIVWATIQILVLSGKVTAGSVKLGSLGLGAITGNIKPKDHWYSIDTPVGLREKRSA